LGIAVALFAFVAFLLYCAAYVVGCGLKAGLG